PRCVASVKAESLPEYPGLVPAAWVQWVQAIVLDFTDIEDRLIALRQTRHDRTLASHAVWCKHVSSSDPEKGGEHLDAQSRFRLDNQSATAKQKFPSSSAVAGLRTFHTRLSGDRRIPAAGSNRGCVARPIPCSTRWSGEPSS